MNTKLIKTVAGIALGVTALLIMDCTAYNMKQAWELSQIVPQEDLFVIESSEASSSTETVLSEPAKDLIYYDVPLSAPVQQYLINVCRDSDVSVPIVLAIIQVESGYDASAISPSGDYGLMQINEINHARLTEILGCYDYCDPYQNISAGVLMFKECLNQCNGDGNLALMVWQYGYCGAQKLWAKGITQTEYTNRIMAIADEFTEFAQGAGIYD